MSFSPPWCSLRCGFMLQQLKEPVNLLPVPMRRSELLGREDTWLAGAAVGAAERSLAPSGTVLPVRDESVHPPPQSTAPGVRARFSGGSPHPRDTRRSRPQRPPRGPSASVGNGVRGVITGLRTGCGDGAGAGSADAGAVSTQGPWPVAEMTVLPTSRDGHGGRRLWGGGPPPTMWGGDCPHRASAGVRKGQPLPEEEVSLSQGDNACCLTGMRVGAGLFAGRPAGPRGRAHRSPLRPREAAGTFLGAGRTELLPPAKDP